MTKPYQVLARKYRPSTFDDLVGQDLLVQSLTNALNGNRLAHAYLLTGLRGIGKTTTARILAKALNCLGEDGDLTAPTATPCGVCANCVAISEDRHVDVIEMDAASNTGIDNIRDNIIAGISYKPTQARFKVFIIDEVHMLSKGAFNALLKTLEEPPEHVKFIFATTDVHKLPVTVLSRCQRYNLPRLEQAELATHLKNIAEKEATTLEHDAALLLAAAAEGSARDGLSLLDQAIALSGEGVNTATVQSMLGATDQTSSYELFKALMAGNVEEALKLAAAAYKNGAEPAAILADIQYITHLVTRLKVVPNAIKGQDLSVIDQQEGPSLAEKLVVPVLTRTWQLLLKGLEEIKLCSQPFQALEMVLIRICYVQEVLGQPPEKGLGVRGLGLESRADKSTDSITSSNASTKSVNSTNLAIVPNRAPSLKTLDPITAPAALDSFEAVVQLIEDKKDRLLAWHLKNQVHLQEFKQGYIKLALKKEAIPNLGVKLTTALKEHANQQWQIETSNKLVESNLQTLEQQRVQAYNEKLEKACNTPVIIRAKELFPDAVVTVPK